MLTLVEFMSYELNPETGDFVSIGSVYINPDYIVGVGPIDVIGPLPCPHAATYLSMILVTGGVTIIGREEFFQFLRRGGVVGVPNIPRPGAN